MLIAGGGNLGRALAAVLLGDGHKVMVIESDRQTAAKLRAEVGVQVTEGDAADPSVLSRAGIDAADVVVAATGHDEDNLVISTLAKFEFSVKRVIARVNNPRNHWMFAHDTGVDVALNQAELIARLVQEEAALSDLVTLLRLREGEVGLVEEIIAEGSPLVGRTIGDLRLPEDVVVVAVLHNRRVLVPTSSLALAAGDEVLFL
ncbi:MAG: potassium channel family protein, partial [Chloroflexota bacterium]